MKIESLTARVDELATQSFAVHAINSRQSSRRPRGACFSCRQFNHRAAECPTRQTQHACYVCGRRGHFARDCYDRFQSKPAETGRRLTTNLKIWTGLSIYIFGKLKPTAAILKGPPEEYSGVTETNIKTLIFSNESWRTKYVHCILIAWQRFPLLCSDATEISNMAVGGPFNMAAVGNNKSILWSSQNSLVTFMFGVVEWNILAAF